MKRYFQTINTLGGESSKRNHDESHSSSPSVNETSGNSSKFSSLPEEHEIDDVDVDKLEADPGLRRKFSDFPVNMRDEIRRAYLIKGPCQPKGSFPYTDYSGEQRRFNPSWYVEHKGWLEYSVHEDAAYCLPCYLFRSDTKSGGGREAFISAGVRCWNKKKRIDDHVGGPNRQGLNQQIGLKRPGDTRWGSHLGALTNLMDMFSSVVDVLNEIQCGCSPEIQGKAISSLLQIQTFEFVFHMKLMIEVLAITNELSIALQRKDQDLVNAMELIRCSKKRLQELRDVGWEPLLDDVISFCIKEQINVPNMNDLFTLAGRTRRSTPHQPTNLHHYQVELFYEVIDMQLQELNTRFGEVNTRLLDCISCFSPTNSFAAFDKAKLMSLTEFYPEEFPSNVHSRLDQQLRGYISHVKEDRSFDGLKGIDELARKLVEREKDTLYPLVFLLLKLVLTLPVATASCERAFSAMKIIKNDLRNRLSDQFMNDCLVVYIEKAIFCNLSDESILETFQNMKSRRGSL